MAEEPTFSARGFAHMDALDCSYGGTIRAYESSAADSPHVWINILQGPRIEAKPGEAVAHLSLETALRLRDQLTYLIDNHYQVRDDGR